MEQFGKALQYGLLGLIRGYRWLISPVFMSRCRFYPSCSEYGEQAITSLGVMRGTAITVLRLLKCHPLCKGGFDPVPDK